MRSLKKLIGWFFTYPPYRELTAEQSEGVVAILALALVADGEPEPTEREELERELTGVPHFWADERKLRDIVSTLVARAAHEPFEQLVAEAASKLEGVSSAFLLAGAAFVCHGDENLTALERDRLTAMGGALGIASDVVEQIVSEPSEATRNLFEGGA